MSRRVSLPAADDLFRRTSAPEPDTAPETRTGSGSGPEVRRQPAAVPETAVDPAEKSAGRRPSGRVRHDEKMTVYVTSDELLDIEHARLLLRRTHGMAVDRGRLVRSAISLALADFEQHGEDSALVQRLRDS